MGVFQKYTLETLKKNKVRTFVTIIGIILSVAMFTAITTIISSLQSYMVNVAIEDNGSWYISFKDINGSDKDMLLKSSEIKKKVSLEEIGYAELDEVKYAEKPYVYLVGADQNCKELLPIHLTEGRMPEKEGEILLPTHLQASLKSPNQLGDQVTFQVGQRVDKQGDVLTQNSSYDEENEKIVKKEEKKYTVVGFYEQPSFEGYDSPGYTAITVPEKNPQHYYEVYVSLKKIGNTFQFEEKQIEKMKSPIAHSLTNTELLRYSGNVKTGTMRNALYSMAGILIGIVMLGAITLIYNAFSISVGERTKQFGLLKSIGATKRQIRNCVLFEAFSLCCISIPLGIVAGIGGIGTTLYLLRGKFNLIVAEASTVPLKLVISWQGIIVAVIVSVITVFISALIPARRTMRMNAIEAIRQSQDIKVKPRQVKGGKWTYRLFGFEGMLAYKYSKRNKKRYRATIISLFFSIVLFISTSTFCEYMTSSVENLVDDYTCEITGYSYSSETEINHLDVEKQFHQIEKLDGVDDCAYILDGGNISGLILNKDDIYTKEYFPYLKAMGFEKTEEDFARITLVFMEDKEYRAYLKEKKLDESTYMDTKNPVAVVYNNKKYYDDKQEKYITFAPYQSSVKELELEVPKEKKGYSQEEIIYDDNGKKQCEYFDEDSGETMTLPYNKENVKKVKIKIGALVNGSTPRMISRSEYSGGSYCQLLYPYSARDTVLRMFSKKWNQMGSRFITNYYIWAKNADKAWDSVDKYQEKWNNNNEDISVHFYNQKEEIDTNRALLLVVQVFVYGFVTLISLIAVANVFHTISTNIQLRGREFAMLKSVGMSQKGLLRMMKYECLLYGIKSLAVGIPVSIGASYLISKSVGQGIEMGYIFPGMSIVITVIGVFGIVFTTMLYGMNKLKKENVMDALKKENI